MQLKYRLLLSFILIAFFTLQYPHLSGAATIEEQRWKTLTDDPDFGYRAEKEMVSVPAEIPQHSAFQQVAGMLVAFLSGTTGKLITWLCLFSLIFYLLSKVWHTGTFPNTLKHENTTTTPGGNEVPAEDILSADWEQMITNAIHKEDYRLAIRYAYMRLLQLLQRNQLISYRTDKTNHDYDQELHATVKKTFRELTTRYEYTWYGNVPADRNAIDHYIQSLNQLKKQIRNL